MKKMIESSRKGSASIFVGIFWAVVFSWALAMTVAATLRLSETLHSVVFCVTLVTVYALMKTAPGAVPSEPQIRWTVLAASLMAIWFMFIRLFGSVDIDAIAFHLRYDVGSNEIVGDVLWDAMVALLPFALMCVSWWRLSMRSGGLRIFNRILPVFLLVCNPLLWTAAGRALASSVPPVVDLNDHYHPPSVTPPPERRNLIHVFVESAEGTLWQANVFGDVADPLKRLAANGWRSTGMMQLGSTGWTLAGHVASTCGVPLFSLGVIHTNGYDNVDEILPHANCLGDILANNGYFNVFLKGASLDFAGTRGFAEAHGYNRLLGYEELQERFPGRKNTWGLHDEDLFTIAHEQVKSLSASERPFSLTMTTIGGHAPEGYVSPSCKTEAFVQKQVNNTLKAFACTNVLLERFIQALHRDGLLNDTVLIIQSDHLAMRNDASHLLEALPRENMFFVLGAEVHGVTNKAASTIDIFPTILQLMGYNVPDAKVGLGRSLLSPQPTLVEQYGVGDLDHAIGEADDLRDRLWGLVRQAS